MDSIWTVTPKILPEKNGFKLLTSCNHWCLGPDSNRHGVTPRGILSPLRLPVPPPRLLVLRGIVAAIIRKSRSPCNRQLSRREFYSQNRLLISKESPQARLGSHNQCRLEEFLVLAFRRFQGRLIEFHGVLLYHAAGAEVCGGAFHGGLQVLDPFPGSALVIESIKGGDQFLL